MAAILSITMETGGVTKKVQYMFYSVRPINHNGHRKIYNLHK